MTKYSVNPIESATTPPAAAQGFVTIKVREIKLVVDRLLMTAQLPDERREGLVNLTLSLFHNEGDKGLVYFYNWIMNLRSNLQASSGERPQITIRDLNAPLEHQDLVINTGWLLPFISYSIKTSGAIELAVRSHESDLYLLEFQRILTDTGHTCDLSATSGLTTLHVTKPAGETTIPLVTYWQQLSQEVSPGIKVHAQNWWNLYFRSNEALSMETDASRYHTGDTMRVTNEGNFIYLRGWDPRGRYQNDPVIHIDR